MHEKVPAVGRRRNVLDEQIVQAIVGMPICQREVQGALHLLEQNCRAFRSCWRPEDKLSDVAPCSACAKSGSTNVDALQQQLWCFKTELPLGDARDLGPSADTYTLGRQRGCC